MEGPLGGRIRIQLTTEHLMLIDDFGSVGNSRGDRGVKLVTQVDRRTAPLGKAAAPAVPDHSLSGLLGFTSLLKTMNTHSTDPSDFNMNRALPLDTDRSERELAPI